MISNDPRGQLVLFCDHGPRPARKHGTQQTWECTHGFVQQTSGRCLFDIISADIIEVLLGCSSWDAHLGEIGSRGSSRVLMTMMHITTTTCHSADIGVARVPTKHWGVVGRGWSLSLCSPRWGLGCSATVCDQCIHRRFEHLAIAVRSLSNETGSSCSDRA